MVFRLLHHIHSRNPRRRGDPVPLQNHDKNRLKGTEESEISEIDLMKAMKRTALKRQRLKRRKRSQNPQRERNHTPAESTVVDPESLMRAKYQIQKKMKDHQLVLSLKK